MGAPRQRVIPDWPRMVSICSSFRFPVWFAFCDSKCPASLAEETWAIEPWNVAVSRRCGLPSNGVRPSRAQRGGAEKVPWNFPKSWCLQTLLRPGTVPGTVALRERRSPRQRLREETEWNVAPAEGLCLAIHSSRMRPAKRNRCGHCASRIVARASRQASRRARIVQPTDGRGMCLASVARDELSGVRPSRL